MKKYKETYIIGIDHGYGNMKTANCCFQAGVTVYDKEPIFKDNLLVWNNRYYLISAEHKEFSADKMLDEDYYILTLAAIARELNIAKIYSADVIDCRRASADLGKRTARRIQTIFAEERNS